MRRKSRPSRTTPDFWKSSRPNALSITRVSSPSSSPHSCLPLFADTWHRCGTSPSSFHHVRNATKVLSLIITASSNHLLLFLDQTEPPPTPNRETANNSAGSNSAASIRSFRTALEQPARSPAPRDSPEMESFKRKLSVARRPDTGARDVIRELNQYKQNNAALQRQIESLMAKLNQSKKNERTLATTLEEIEKSAAEWQGKASTYEKLEKSAKALQNTIDHLEYRLEVANSEKLDAEEQLFNLQLGQTPFHGGQSQRNAPETPRLNTDVRNAHMSMDTVFSSDSPIVINEGQDSTTLGAFVSHIERLQEEVRQKDARIADLEKMCEDHQRTYALLDREQREMSLQADIQEELLKRAKQAESHIAELRAAILERESTIQEKEKEVRMAERQLDYHKLLLHAEVRKHATMSLFSGKPVEPLPDLASVASKEDVDKWVARLQARLKKEKTGGARSAPNRPEDMATVVKDLRQEIDFYVREIIYYKLDIKGYKSDIKKLKNITARMGTHSRASDVESPTPSQCPSSYTPVRARATRGTSTPSPATMWNRPAVTPVTDGRTVTPNAGAILTPDPSPADTVKPMFANFDPSLQHTPMTPQTPTQKNGFNIANDRDQTETGVSPRSVVKLSPERRKPTVRGLIVVSYMTTNELLQPPSPEQEKFGDMATNFPLGTPAAPKRHDTQRSMSDSIIQLYTTPRTPDWSPAAKPTPPSTEEANTVLRQRSSSLPETHKGRTTPDRPPRPQYGLWDEDTHDGVKLAPTPPRVDVLAEAERNSPRPRDPDEPTPLFGRKFPDLSTAALRGGSSTHAPPTASTSSASAAPFPLRSRAGSAASSTGAGAGTTSPLRKLSIASGCSITFSGLPISPTATVPPTTCSITGKCASLAPTGSRPSTSRSGIGGTMASTTPVSSPVETTGGPAAHYFHSRAPSTSTSIPPQHQQSHSHTRSTSNPFSLSMPSKRDSENNGPPSRASRSGAVSRVGHSRNTSASSLKNAINLQLGNVGSVMMKGKGKTRKESISHPIPTPLASPFDGVRTEVGVGEAI